MVTWGYVELVADGEAPDLSTDAGWDALPPEFTHTPSVTPASSQQNKSIFIDRSCSVLNNCNFAFKLFYLHLGNVFGAFS